MNKYLVLLLLHTSSSLFIPINHYFNNNLKKISKNTNINNNLYIPKLSLKMSNNDNDNNKNKSKIFLIMII